MLGEFNGFAGLPLKSPRFPLKRRTAQVPPPSGEGYDVHHPCTLSRFGEPIQRGQQ